MAGDKETSEELPLVSRRLDALFRSHLPKDGKGREYSYKQVEKAINDAAGPKSISGQYIWQIRKGESDNPTLRSLQLRNGVGEFASTRHGGRYRSRAADGVDQEVVAHRRAGGQQQSTCPGVDVLHGVDDQLDACGQQRIPSLAVVAGPVAACRVQHDSKPDPAMASGDDRIQERAIREEKHSDIE